MAADARAVAGPLLGLDLGEKRIGVACSDPTRILASPVGVVLRRSRAEDFAALARLAAERRAVGLVVGHPLNMDGSSGPQAKRVARYAQALAEYLALPLILWDERLSTETALERRRIVGTSRSRQPVDAEAAAIILQEYLDAQAR